ncbi:MAG TPA: hypothetical protein VMV18_06420, partial [bacterium]|nr:hypothetical protein [bacterium]
RESDVTIPEITMPQAIAAPVPAQPPVMASSAPKPPRPAQVPTPRNGVSAPNSREDRDIPTVIRNKRREETAEDPVRLAKELGLMPLGDDEYDIPTFLRKQAD